MKEKRTGRSSVKKGTDWKRLRSQSDRQIRRAIESDPEARPANAEFWKKARVVIPASDWMRTFSNGCGNKRVTKRESMPCSGPTWMRIGCPEGAVERRTKAPDSLC